MGYFIGAPYGFNRETGKVRCVNSEPGTFNHECGKPATWIGGNRTDMGHFFAAYCDGCKAHGHEARNVSLWEPLEKVRRDFPRWFTKREEMPSA